MNLQTLHKIHYGVFIVSSRKGENLNGQIANTVFQISATPPTIAISINKENLTHQYIKESNVFSISILSTEAPMTFIGRFGFRSGRTTDKFKDVEYKVGTTGAPIVLEHSVGYIEAEVIGSLDVATHTVFVGKVVDAEILNEKEPMTYEYYHKIKRGLTPKSAPTYIEAKTKEPTE
ncbi:flavin reductase [Candidatus Sumerlaeota bacterium]|nr:flavin reductase [Candidatus Sumerlaeota bacterium]